MKIGQLEDLRSLLRSPEGMRQKVLDALAETAKEVEEMVRDEMMKTEGLEWAINIGFHSIPSMKWVDIITCFDTRKSTDLQRRHVHLHVISDDLISPSLKTKKHVNSFRPDLNFFIRLDEVQKWSDEEESIDDHIRVSQLFTSPCFRSPSNPGETLHRADFTCLRGCHRGSRSSKCLWSVISAGRTLRAYPS